MLATEADGPAETAVPAAAEPEPPQATAGVTVTAVIPGHPTSRVNIVPGSGRGQGRGICVFRAGSSVVQ